jgi:hypothetical protein
MPQGIAIIAFGMILGVPFTLGTLRRDDPDPAAHRDLRRRVRRAHPVAPDSQRQANQYLPVVMLPQFFLAGVFNPVMNLPLPLEILSKLSPMRYAVDVMRTSSTRAGAASRSRLSTNLAVIGVEFVVFMLIGTGVRPRGAKTASTLS